MSMHQIIAAVDLESALGAARAMARKVVLVYVMLVGLWIFIQSGIPIASFVAIKAEPLGWAYTLVGWFFVASTGWLLYLLLDRGLRLIGSAEEALRLRDRAIESSPNAILVTDCRQPDQPIVYVNPAFERLTGYSRAEVIGRNPRFLHGPDGDQSELQALRLAVKEGRECKARLRNYRKDGTMYWNELTIAPMRNSSGEVTHFVGVKSLPM
jgi:PAS domain S-box-containing protein